MKLQPLIKIYEGVLIHLYFGKNKDDRNDFLVEPNQREVHRFFDIDEPNKLLDHLKKLITGIKEEST